MSLTPERIAAAREKVRSQIRYHAREGTIRAAVECSKAMDRYSRFERAEAVWMTEDCGEPEKDCVPEWPCEKARRELLAAVVDIEEAK